MCCVNRRSGLQSAPTLACPQPLKFPSPTGRRTPPEQMCAASPQFSSCRVPSRQSAHAAVRAALDALETVQTLRSGLQQQYLFEHAVLIDPADYDRIYNLGVTVSIQPAHALVGIYGDQADHWQDGRIDRAWDFPALEGADLPIVLGTDWPVWPTVDGLTNWSTAINGLRSRTLTKETVFKGYGNLGRATSGLDHVGLSVGQQADFIVVSSNPFEEEPPTLLETWVRGERVY